MWSSRAILELSPLEQDNLKRTCLPWAISTLAMCPQECQNRNAATARRRRVFVDACSGSEKSVVVVHRRHVWMSSDMSWHVTLYRFRCMCPANNGCVWSSVHSFHDLADRFGIVNNVCQEILSRRGDDAFLSIRVVAVHVELLLFCRRCVWTYPHTHMSSHSWLRICFKI